MFQKSQIHRDKVQLNEIDLIDISAYETLLICRQWSYIFNSIISFIWLTRECIEFSDTEKIEILFKPKTYFFGDMSEWHKSK